MISGGFGSTSLAVALAEAWHQESSPHPCPRFPTAYSLTGVGVATMTVEPTASTSDAGGLINLATRWAAVMPPPAASTPVAQYAIVRVRGKCAMSRPMSGIRSRSAIGIAFSAQRHDVQVRTPSA